MKHIKVLVIGGGISSEREISIRSANAVYESLKEAQIDSELYFWDGTDTWLQDNCRRFDVAFPVLHGMGGEDGHIQKILEHINIPYVGTDSTHSVQCIDKVATRDVLASNGILVPYGCTVDYEQYKTHQLFNAPHVLKPKISGSSIDTFIFPDIRSQKDISAIESAFKRHKIMLLEEYVEGTEITVPVLNTNALPVIEIIPPKNATFDFENKYNGTTRELCPPENVSLEVQKSAQEIAKKVHNIMGCRHLSRTDIIIRDNQLYVLEINTMPGFTPQSLFPKSARVAGLNMSQLTRHLIALALGESIE